MKHNNPHKTTDPINFKTIPRFAQSTPLCFTGQQYNTYREQCGVTLRGWPVSKIVCVPLDFLRCTHTLYTVIIRRKSAICVRFWYRCVFVDDAFFRRFSVVDHRMHCWQLCRDYNRKHFVIAKTIHVTWHKEKLPEAILQFYYWWKVWPDGPVQDTKLITDSLWACGVLLCAAENLSRMTDKAVCPAYYVLRVRFRIAILTQLRKVVSKRRIR